MRERERWLRTNTTRSCFLAQCGEPVMLPRCRPDMTYAVLLIICLRLQPAVIAVTTLLLEQSNLSENGEKYIAIIVRADFFSNH